MISDGDLDVKTFDLVNKISNWILVIALIIGVPIFLYQTCNKEPKKKEPIEVRIVE